MSRPKNLSIKIPIALLFPSAAGWTQGFQELTMVRFSGITWIFLRWLSREKYFLRKNDRVKNIGKSALDPTWTKDVKTKGKKLLLLSEGMLMYLKEA